MTVHDFVLLAVVVLTAGILSAAGCRILLSKGLRWRFMDHPNQRSLHSDPTPRSGGLAIHASIGFAALVIALLGVPLPDAPFWIGWLIIVGVSLCDDVAHVPVAVRLAMQLAAVAVLFGWLGPAFSFAWPLVLVAGLALAWFINLFNFMDGMDGLAGLMAITGALTLALAGLLQDDIAYALLLLATGAAVLGFLGFNWPPAKLFMGDAGSIGLGYLLGALSLVGMARGLFGWFVPLLVFLPFVLDASWTLAVRIARGARPWEAHREHFYQRQVLAGWSVRRILVLEFLIMLVFQGLALFFAVR